MSLNLKSLIGKVNDATRTTLEAAAGLCVSRTHYDIEIEHFLLKAIDSSDNDISYILRQYGVDKSRLTTELQRSLYHATTDFAMDDVHLTTRTSARRSQQKSAA